MTFAVPTNTSAMRFVATHALVIHQISEEGHLSADRCSYITSHRVHQTEQAPVIGAGSLLSLSDQELLREVLTTNTEGESSLLPPNVLCTSARRLVWFVSGQTRPMLVRQGERLRRWQVPWPTLLYKVDNGKLSIAALSTSRRPKERTPLYHAPLANTYEDGAVCTGSAELPRGWQVSQMAAWESVIVNTAFTHVNQRHTLRLDTRKRKDVDNKAHFSFWHRLAEQKVERFPVKALVPMKRTLKEWIGYE
jgi:PRTRC genetic system protein B